jgi:hypothetical protein
MVTTNQILEYLELLIAERRLSGDHVGLKELQTAAGFLMAAANYAGDKDTALRFRVLAAKAANQREELTGLE